MADAKRPKISVYIATSIDGYIARQDGNIDWLNCVQGFEEDYGFHDFFDSIDALIMGRKTYESIMSFSTWPYQGKRVVVLSNTLKSVRDEAELYQGSLTQLASNLYSDGIQHVWADGSAAVSEYLNLGLVDRMIISLIPIVLGSGIPLFKSIGKEVPCRLLSSQSYPSGLVQLRYQLCQQD